MNRVFLIATLLAFAMLGCKTQKTVVNTPNGPVTLLSPKKARALLEEKIGAPQWVRLKANVTVTQNGSTNRGVMELRMKQDSILWVEIADPILGIKAIRAFAMADSVAYQNRIEKNYFAGPYSYVEQKLGTAVPFDYIFNVFLGEVFEPASALTLGEGFYLLNQRFDDGSTFLAQIEPVNMDCTRQVFTTKNNTLAVEYSNFQVEKAFRYPQKIVLQVAGTQALAAEFEVTEWQSGTPQEMPFKISSKYERIK